MLISVLVIVLVSVEASLAAVNCATRGRHSKLYYCNSYRLATLLSYNKFVSVAIKYRYRPNLLMKYFNIGKEYIIMLI